MKSFCDYTLLVMLAMTVDSLDDFFPSIMCTNSEDIFPGEPVGCLSAIWLLFGSPGSSKVKYKNYLCF